MNMKTIGLACAVALSAGSVSAATLDFEGVFTSPAQGMITGTEFEGVTISISDPFGAQGNTPYTLGLYNSACRLGQAPAPNCTGKDDDLATGAGITLPTISADEDTPAEDYILVTSQESGSTFADRVSRALFTFAFDVPSIVKAFALIDIDEVASRVLMTFNFSDGTTGSFNASAANIKLNAGEDNAYSRFDVALIAPTFMKPVDTFSIQFGTGAGGGISGGIAVIEYTPIPVPAALPLLAGALGLLGFAARRRKAA